MNFNEAISGFHKMFPTLTVTRCIDYDSRHFVIEAVEDLTDANYNSPYYGVDKKNGKVTSFIPSFDLDAFFDAVEKRTVYKRPN